MRRQTDFVITQVKSVNWGLESIRVLGPKIWENPPNELKESVDSFKTTIKRWKPESCPYRLYKLIYRTRANCRDRGKTI